MPFYLDYILGTLALNALNPLIHHFWTFRYIAHRKRKNGGDKDEIQTGATLVSNT